MLMLCLCTIAYAADPVTMELIGGDRMTDELRDKILAYNRRIKADRMERDELKAKLDRIREAVDGMTGLPSVSKLAAFLETVREIIKPKEG